MTLIKLTPEEGANALREVFAKNMSKKFREIIKEESLDGPLNMAALIDTVAWYLRIQSKDIDSFLNDINPIINKWGEIAVKNHLAKEST